MGFLRKFFVELIVVAVIVGWAVTKFPEIVTPWMPWLCLVVVWHLAWEVLPRQRIKGFFSRLQGKRFALGILGALIAAVLLSFFVVWGTGVATRKFEVAEKAREEHPGPPIQGNAPKQLQTPTGTPAQSQPLSRPQSKPKKSKQMEQPSNLEDINIQDPISVALIIQGKTKTLRDEWDGYWSADLYLWNHENMAAAKVPFGNMNEAAIVKARQPFEDKRAQLKKEIMKNIQERVTDCDPWHARAVSFLGATPEDDDKKALFHSIEEGSFTLSQDRVLWICTYLNKLADRLLASGSPLTRQ